MLGPVVVASPGAAQESPTCMGHTATIVALEGQVTTGTPGDDVIVGTAGDDVINSLGGNDRICARAGDDQVSGGPGADRIDLGAGDDVGRGGAGNDLIKGRGGADKALGGAGRDRLVGGRGNDDLRGGRGSDTLRGGNGSDRLRGGSAADDCRGGAGTDRVSGCEPGESQASNGFGDDFAGSGPLEGWTTNNASALPDVARVDGRYRASVTDNTGNRTLHFHADQGRLDARPVAFPFDIVVRNVGIGTPGDSQTAPSPAGDPYVFAGVQVHVPDLDEATSSHVVVGHRGGVHFTIEGKNTVAGSSSVNDDGFGVLPDGRADIRIVGNADRTLTVYWQTPNLDPQGSPDDWNLYRGSGALPGAAPSYPDTVYVGLITYAYGSTGLPFVGTADGVEDYAAS